MPRKVKDYSKALIYKICCKNPEVKEIYVGSTTDIIRRRYCHKTSCTNPNQKGYNYKVYNFIREHGGWNNWSLILIEFYPCTTELELGRREDHFKNELQSSLNTRTPHIYDDRKEYENQYRQANLEKKKETDKQYRQANREKKKETDKQYRQANREKLKEKAKQKKTCECGCIVGIYDISRHRKSTKHINLVKQTDKEVLLLSAV